MRRKPFRSPRVSRFVSVHGLVRSLRVQHWPRDLRYARLDARHQSGEGWKSHAVWASLPSGLELYQLRNDCVHGKIPFLDLRSKGAAGEARAAKLHYVAEKVVREALLVALRFSDQSVFATREALEKAWSAGKFPPATPPISPTSP